MKVRDALAEGSAVLSGGRSGSPDLDASLLLARAAGVDRSRLLAMLPDSLDAAIRDEFDKLIQRRAAGESVAYIVGYKEFYGRNFLVDSRVLVPRPETELLVEGSLARLPPVGSAGVLRCHDAFTGSGCVGITLACERVDLLMELSDASTGALEVCARNASALFGPGLAIREGNVLSAAAGSYNLITANPPYVSSSLTDAIIAEGGREPRLALDGGRDGLSLYAALVGGAFALLAPGGWLLAEIGDEQGEAVSVIFREAGFAAVETLADLADHDRVVAGRKR